MPLSDVREFIAQGADEAEACGDSETQVVFLVEAVQLNLVEGRPVNETKSLLNVKHTLSLKDGRSERTAEVVVVLQEALNLMTKMENLSSPSHLLRATAWLQLVDLEAASAAVGGDNLKLLEQNKARYLRAHDWLLAQLQSMGEKIERRWVLNLTCY